MDLQPRRRPELILYDELASWWPLLSAPCDYEDEAGYYASVLLGRSKGASKTLLELGSGGGNNASHMKGDFASVTLVDSSPEMLAVSRRLNPECEHAVGDMRSVRLERTFDCVFVHDAVNYMTTLGDLGRVAETVRVHCASDGVALFAPDFVRENFRATTGHGGHDADDGRGLRYLEWSWDPDPADATYKVEYAVLTRTADGKVKVRHDSHLEGLFSIDEWRGGLEGAGFRSEVLRRRHEGEEVESVLFVAEVAA